MNAGVGDIDVVHARLFQVRAIVAAINVVLTDRINDPGGGHMTDNVLQGLSDAAVDLLDQADKAAKGFTYIETGKEAPHGKA